MALHFTPSEFEQRLASARELIQSRKLDALLLFAPESHYYLTGFDTFGFAMFQCLVVPAVGDPHLLTRMPDLRQAQQTSNLSDSQIHIWHEHEQADPVAGLHQLLRELGVTDGQLGVEYKTVGLNAWNGKALDSHLTSNGYALEDASDLVSSIRRIKSPAEIDCTRKAAELSDLALDAAIANTAAGAFEGDILAAMQGAVFSAGGDYAGNEFIIGSGEGALLCRYFSGRRHLDPSDQLTLEWSGAWRRYHAAMMRTLITGKATPKQKAMHHAAVEALQACEAAIKPGAPMGDVYAAHAQVFDQHGLAHARLQACGYGMGAVYNPIWVDYPMFYENNPMIMQPGSVFFLHMILMDSDAGLAMCWGHSVLLGDSGVERLSKHSLDLIEL